MNGDKYKAEGDLGTTFGIQTEDGYFTQTKYPDGSLGQINELDESGHWGWDWWLNKYNPDSVDEFPDEVDL